MLKLSIAKHLRCHLIVCLGFSISILLRFPVFVQVACAIEANNSSEAEIAEQLLTNIYKDRLKIQSLEIEWQIEILTHKSHPVLEGCQYSLHAWFDYSEGRMRVDSMDKCPKDDRMTRNRRFAFAADRFLIVDGENLAGHEIEGKNKDYIKNKNSGTAFSLSGDMRLMGVLPERYSTLKNYSHQEILRPLADSKGVAVSKEKLAGKMTNKVRFHGYYGVDCNLTYWLDTQHGLPLQILCESNTKKGLLKTELQTKWQPFPQLESSDNAVYWLPAHTITRRWEKGELVLEERLKTMDAVVGTQPEDGVFTWQRMRLPDDFVVIHAAGKSRQMKQWDSKLEEFGPWNSRPLITREEMVVVDGRSSTQRVLMLFFNGAVIVILIGFLAWKRIRVK